MGLGVDRLPVGAMLCSYNGHVFNPTADTVAFSVKPVPDPANRTVMAAQYTITVTEFIAGVGPTDALVKTAIAQLSRNAGKLRYKGRGFGDLDINLVPAGPRDVKWGPWTKEIKCAPDGAGIGVRLTWTVEFLIPNCDDAVFAGVMSFVFSLTFAIDTHGYTTRTYQSVLRLAATKKAVDDPTLPDQADAHREKTVPGLLVGFRRTSQNFQLSFDKQELTTTVVDEQMNPNLPPVGVVEAKFEHTWQMQAMARWTTTFSALYDIDRVNATPLAAVTAFMTQVNKRLDEVAKMRTGAGLPGGFKLPKAAAGAGNPVAIIPMTAQAAEPNVYGRTQVRLAATYMVAGIGFTEILKLGGLWMPTDVNDPAGNWKKWSASVPTSESPRGHARLSFKADEDKIIDLCRKPPEQFIVTGAGGVGFGVGGPFGGETITGRLIDLFLKPIKALKPATSWLEYIVRIVVHTDTGRVLGKTLPTAPIGGLVGTLGGIASAGGAWDVMGGLPRNDALGTVPFPSLTGLSQTGGRTGGETFIHQRTRPTLYVTIFGQALRVGYQIPVPEVVEINGAKPVMIGRPYFASGIVGNTLVPVVRADWKMTYVCTDAGGIPAGVIPVPPNDYMA